MIEVNHYGLERGTCDDSFVGDRPHIRTRACKNWQPARMVTIPPAVPAGKDLLDELRELYDAVMRIDPNKQTAGNWIMLRMTLRRMLAE